MYAIETGLFPFAGLLVGGVLYGLYYWLLRLKCGSRWAQTFLTVTMLLVVMATFLKPVRLVEMETLVETGSPLEAGIQVDYATPMESEKALESMILIEPETHAEEAPVSEHHPAASLLADVSLLMGWLYLAGVAAVVLWFLGQLAWLYALRRRCTRCQVNGVEVYEQDTLFPFSFGRNIFLPTDLDNDIVRYVLMHEQAHVRHHHFLKLCALQLLVALCWFNPFMWLMYGEMRLLHEFEVDDDMLQAGIDREQYQLSLLRVCVKEGKWILIRSTYGFKPLKQRIIFMNKTMNTPTMRRRQTVAAIGLLLVALTTGILSCQTREKQTEDNLSAEHHHPMRGCWTMDWISNTGSGEEVHPVAMHYGFYNDSTFLCFSYWSKKGVNLNFSISGEGYTWRGDSLLDAAGNLTDYTLAEDGRTALSRWLKDSTQMAGVSGPDITEQWSRIKPNEDLMTVFKAVSFAKANTQRPLDGVWMADSVATGKSYCLINDSIFMFLNLHPSTVTEGFRYGGSGFCGSMNVLKENYSFNQPDADHLVFLVDQKPYQYFVRTDMPQYIQRAFSPALYVDKE